MTSNTDEYDDDDLFDILDKIIDYDNEHKIIEKIDEKCGVIYDEFKNNGEEDILYEIDEIEEVDEIEDIQHIINNNKVIDMYYCEICLTSEHTIENHKEGNMVCTSCGNVFGKVVSTILETRYFEDSECQSKRCGNVTNPLLPNMSMSTTIAGRYNKLKRLQSWNSIPYRERKLFLRLKLISEICKKCKLLKCIEDDTKILYKHLMDTKKIDKLGNKTNKNVILRGKRSIYGMASACIFIACKRKGDTLGKRELAKLMDIDAKIITVGHKKIRKWIYGISIDYKIRSSLPIDFIPRFCKILNFDKEQLNFTINVVKNIDILHLCPNHIPQSVATCGIIVTNIHLKLNINIKDILSKLCITEATVKKTLESISKYNHIIIDTELCKKIKNYIEAMPNELPPELEEKHKYIKNNINILFKNKI